MPLIPYPAVPPKPGVPPLPRDFSLSIPYLEQSVYNAAGGLLFGSSVWGIYTQDGGLALEPDTFISISATRSASIASYPLDVGFSGNARAFSSYNKVVAPIGNEVKMAFSGNAADCQVFLTKISLMVSSTELYSIVTPQAAFANVNLIKFTYGQSVPTPQAVTGGPTMLLVDLAFQEVNLSATALFSQVKEPSGADPVNDGQVQAMPTASTSVVRSVAVGDIK
ncbi:hypothetical protein [Bordetella sp. LUAb4]|uniref:hypothetical protein n=1 Tax=Bordetella sp. LUAb4 TaxID=2843195 RepID=UPI001E380042|nr:hypothetical protein [Bordetella sp. LUAb4]